MTHDEFKNKYPSKEFNMVSVRRDYTLLGDPAENYYTRPVEDKGWEMYLGHQCDEWVIGDVEDAESLIQNLKEAVEYCKSN